MSLWDRMRGVKAFKRGIHPPHRKYTADRPIELFSPQKPLFVALSQHIGAACEATVKPKQAVTIGERIADTQAFVSAPIHATVNGVIGPAAIMLIAGGRRVPTVQIKPDLENGPQPPNLLQTYLLDEWGAVEPTQFDPDMIVDKVRSGGLVGLGGATFPTHVKLKRNPKRPVDTLILNGCECEPYLTADYRLMLEAPQAVVAGMRLAARACGAERCIIAIEANKAPAIDVMRKQVADDPQIEVAVCADKYPMGGERQLIAAVTGRVTPSAPKGLPLDVGCVVINISTAHGIAHAVVHDRPLTHRVVTVTGQGVANPGNYLTPVGTSAAELVEHAGGDITDAAFKVLAGGPMMGQTLPMLKLPTTKGLGGLTVMVERETAHWNEGPCVRCGRCIDNCPLYLSPTKVAVAVKHRDYALAADYDLMACCECGCCSYVCPAGIPLTQYMRAGKNQLRTIAAQKRAQQKAEEARQAPEAPQQPPVQLTASGTEAKPS